MLKLFEETYKSDIPKCSCCYACIQSHSMVDGCLSCSEFLRQFFPAKKRLKVTRTVAIELKDAMSDLFSDLNLDKILIEKELEVSPISFTKDFIKNIDEVRSEEDIVRIWHIEQSLAKKIYMLLNDVISEPVDDNLSSDVESDTSAEDSDSFDTDDVTSDRE